MPSDHHLHALHRADNVSAHQSPFGGTFQVVTNGVPGKPIAAHDMVCGQAETELESGGVVRVETLSFAVLKTVLRDPLVVRSLIRARNRLWIVQAVSGEDPAQSSWKFTSTPQ